VDEAENSALAALKEEINGLKKRIEIAKKIIQRRIKRGMFDLEDVTRILNGQWHYYITFSERWRDKPHPYLPEAHPDRFMVIENATSRDEAMTVAKEFCGRAFCYPVSEAEWGFHLTDEIERIDANNYIRRDCARQ